MDEGQAVYIVCRLVLGTVAAFLAIVLWSKSRDAAWMFMVLGTLVSYLEVIYSIMLLFGVSAPHPFYLGSVSIAALALECLPWLFYITAFAIMAIRKRG
jgi:hypothetical protein